MRGFFVAQDGRGVTALQPSDYIDARVLTAATSERHTIPDGAGYVSIRTTDDIYVKFGDNTVTATVPAGDVTDGTASEIVMAEERMVFRIPAAATDMALISSGTPTVTLSFYAAF